jgi:hypothetical protein
LTSGFHPLSGILITRKHTLSEIRSVLYLQVRREQILAVDIQVLIPGFGKFHKKERNFIGGFH